MFRPAIHGILRDRRRARAGFTLVELIIAMAILSIAVVGFVSSFRYISRSIHISRARTLASNLAQEKIENMKDFSYHKLQLSTSTEQHPFFTDILYDDTNIPPETILIGGLTFTRATFVAFADVTNNVISTVTFNYPDTGMKMLRVYIFWQEKGNWKKMHLENIYENPDIDPLNTNIDGCVQTADDCDSGNGVASALVEVLGTSWKDTADENGEFLIAVHAGTYTVRASSHGFFSDTRYLVGAATGTTTTVAPNFTLTRIATGTVTGNVWLNTNLVISQIVSSTVTYVPNEGGYEDVEYIELFNPTTFTITLDDGGTHKIKLDYNAENGAGSDCDDTCFDLTYDTPTVGPGKYFLIASTKQFMVLGELHTADATYGTLGGNFIATQNDLLNSHAGCIRILDANNAAIDTVGWADDTGSAPYWAVPDNCYETSPIPDSGFTDGILRGRQVVRISSPLLVSDTYGRAYDSHNNRLDFYYPYAGGFDGMIAYAPHDTSDAAQTILAGKVATGAFVTADDRLGPTATADIAYIASGALNIPYAHFNLSGVSTGTWTLLVSSGTGYIKISSVVVSAMDSSTDIPNGATDPAWGTAGHSGMSLNLSSVEGYISGTVQNIDNVPLASITLNVAGQPKTTGDDGRYFAQVSSGLITLVANEANMNSLYVEEIKQVTINTGQIAVQDFSLSQGGVLTGFLTTDGSSILPGVEVTAKIDGAQYGSGTSDASGYFYIKNLATATYTVEPGMDSSEVSTPGSSTATVIVNETVFVATFTIVGSLGELSGIVSVAGSSLTAGALILASTMPISSTPPLIVGSSAPAMTFIYAASSKADGTYTMEVRGGSDPYYLSAFIPTITNGTVSIATLTYSGIISTASATTTKNIVIP